MKNPKQTLGKIIRHFKARSSKVIHDVGYPDFKWQRHYYEHIIRDEKDIKKIRKYIEENPVQWYYDKENPENIKMKFA